MKKRSILLICRSAIARLILLSNQLSTREGYVVITKDARFLSPPFICIADLTSYLSYLDRQHPKFGNWSRYSYQTWRKVSPVTSTISLSSR